MGECLGKPVDSLIHRFYTAMHFGKQAPAFGPVGIAPERGVNGEVREIIVADLSFHGGAHHEGADAHGQLAQFYFRSLGGDGIVYRSGKAHAAAYAFALYAAHDQLVAGAHGIDNAGEAAEKAKAFFFGFYGYQLVE